MDFEAMHICHANEFCMAFGIAGEFENFNAPKDNSVAPVQVGNMNASNSLEGGSEDAEGSDE